MSDSTEKVAVGTLTGMEPRSSGWFRFTIQEPNRQYPVKLDTKKPEIVEQCKALMGSSVKAAYVEQESTNTNPNTGNPYTNRYLNQIAAASSDDVSSQPQQAQPQQTPAQGTGAQPMQSGPSETVRELRIMRMGASERAVAMLAAGAFDARFREDKSVSVAEVLVEAAETWVAYFVYGAARFGVPAFDAGVAPPETKTTFIPVGPQGDVQTSLLEYMPAGADMPPHTDDDIPF